MREVRDVGEFEERVVDTFQQVGARSPVHLPLIN